MVKTIVISGSFHRFYNEIKEIIFLFESLGGVKVLSPKISEIINPGEEFAILKSDLTQNPEILERNHLKAIEKADILYICNPEGYLGNSAIFELGFATALGKKIFCKEPIADVTLKIFSGKVATPEQIKEEFFIQ